MRLQGKPLAQVEWADLEALVRDQVPESVVLDYKERLPEATPGARRDFLADVAAMANTRGGVLLYGAREARDTEAGKTDLPEAIVGLAGESAAEAQLRLEQTIRSGLDPPLTGCIVRTFPLPVDNHGKARDSAHPAHVAARVCGSLESRSCSWT